jgi:apolipoprotein D and lipocalin family protein
VINRCRQSQDEEDSIKGVARVVDSKTNAKLQVSFVRFLGRNWFWGDYWIIGLDEQYQWAVVGTPNRRYGWILARTKSLAEADQQKCFEILQRQGYNPDDFVATVQE